MITISGTFSITIRAANHAPVWAANPPPIVFKSGVSSRYNVRQFVSDSDGDELVITVNGSLDAFPGVSFDGTDLVFDGRAVNGQNIVGTLVFSADDGRESDASSPA